MNFKIIQTNRGKECLICDQHKYRLCYTKKTGETLWRCSSQKLCKAILTLNSGKSLILNSNDKAHNHAQYSEKELDLYEFRNECKRKANDELCVRPNKIMRTVLKDVPELFEIEDIYNVRRAMYNVRRKKIPTLAKTRREVIDQLIENVEEVKTSREEKFCFVDETNEIVIFTCSTNIKHISKVELVLADGTFDFAPKFFQQLYTIHGYKNGYYCPLVFALLPSKSTVTYINMWRFLINICRQESNIELNINSIILDYEMAAHKALGQLFPN